MKTCMNDERELLILALAVIEGFVTLPSHDKDEQSALGVMWAAHELVQRALGIMGGSEEPHDVSEETLMLCSVGSLMSAIRDAKGGVQ